MLFSVIICTYNPRHDYLLRVIESCMTLVKGNSDAELILVDNNSSPPLADNEIYRAFTGPGKCSLIAETKQGLAYARLAGIRIATGKVIVFMDDDNVPASNYLEILRRLLAQYPKVGAWGPGTISLEFTEGAPLWVKKHCGHLLQEKKNANIGFGQEAGWPWYYPAGSGLTVKREVLEQYEKLFSAGSLTSVGRSGETLTSAEDSQIVWTAVKMGYNAGTSPELNLIHLIPAKRTTLKYLSKLNFSIAQSYRAALLEMFPEKSSEFRKRSMAGKMLFAVRLLVSSRFDPILFYRRYAIENSWFKGVQV
jgi:glycosyltransferase involved in cell wall biosynthesis